MADFYAFIAGACAALLAYRLFVPRIDKRTARLIVAARVAAWGDSDDEEMRELQDASEAFAADLPWEEEDIIP